MWHAFLGYEKSLVDNDGFVLADNLVSAGVWQSLDPHTTSRQPLARVVPTNLRGGWLTA